MGVKENKAVRKYNIGLQIHASSTTDPTIGSL